MTDPIRFDRVPFLRAVRALGKERGRNFNKGDADDRNSHPSSYVTLAVVCGSRDVILAAVPHVNERRNIKGKAATVTVELAEPAPFDFVGALHGWRLVEILRLGVGADLVELTAEGEELVRLVVGRATYRLMDSRRSVLDRLPKTPASTAEELLR